MKRIKAYQDFATCHEDMKFMQESGFSCFITENGSSEQKPDDSEPTHTFGPPELWVEHDEDAEAVIALIGAPEKVE